jgi:hypothetical protein
MSKRQKRLQRLRQNPTNVSLDELRQVLEDFGFEHRHTTGSHYTFNVELADGSHLLVVPFNRPVKTIYVRKALGLIDKVLGETGVGDEPEED